MRDPGELLPESFEVAPALYQEYIPGARHVRLNCIVDLKLTPDDELVWLEVNPQGQFLFVEGMTGMPLTAHFAAYLSSLQPSRV